MITLYGFGKAFGLVDPSPFVVKVDMFLRMTGLTYQYVGDVNKLTQAPKKKLPIIKDDDFIVADSYFIFRHLKEKYKLTIDNHLSLDQQSQAHLITKSLDENFYWCVVYSRWIKDDTWPTVKNALFGKMPAPLKLFVPAMARRGVRKTLYAQGLGRHNDAEILQIFEHTLKSLSHLLGQKAYFFGEQSSSFDATAFAFLASVILANLDNAFNHQAKTYANLVAYCQRLQEMYYSEST